MKFGLFGGLFLAGCFCGALLSPPTVRAASDRNQAKITRIIREVTLLSGKSGNRPAVLDEKVSEGTGVRTGTKSRSELTFVDLTITRLGENTVFTFDDGGRSVDLQGGSLLYRVPKDSGGAHVTTDAVTVGITGTTVMVDKRRAGNRLRVLEGSARISLNKYPNETAMVHGGQMIDVPPGATKLPPVTNFDVDHVMKNDPLITDFSPLPSRDLIYAAKSNPPPPPPIPVPGPGAIVPPIVGGLVGIPIPIGGSTHTVGTSGTHRSSGSEHTSRGGKTTGDHGSKPSVGVSSTGAPKTRPTATPVRRKPSKYKSG